MTDITYATKQELVESIQVLSKGILDGDKRLLEVCKILTDKNLEINERFLVVTRTFLELSAYVELIHKELEKLQRELRS